MIELRDYQSELITSTRAHFRQQRKRVLINLATGGGKTAICARMLHNAAQRQKRVWFLCHRRELIRQVSKAFQLEGINYGMVTADARMNLAASAQICSIPTLIKRLDRLPPPDLIAFDECFPAGTLVDGKPIEEIKCGDMVRCFDHEKNVIVSRTVVRLFSSAPSALVRVHFAGAQLTCTPGHPFFVLGRGYVSAINLSPGDIFVQDMRYAGSDREQIPEGSIGKSRVAILWERVLGALSGKDFIGNHGKDQSKARFRSNEVAQSNATCLRARKDEGLAESNWTPSIGSWWKRKAIDGASVQATGSDSRAFAGIRFPHLREARLRLSWALQNRFGASAGKASHRDRWCKSFFFESKSSGLQEREPTGFTRVDRVEVLEPASDGKFRGSLPDGLVYNIEVEEHHNYFAGGILVHNCHHIAAGTWSMIAKRFPNAYQVGLSATPVRLDGAGLGDYFDAMVCGPSVRWLIENGYLSPYRLFAPMTVNTAGLHKRGGEYVNSEASRLITPKIIGDALSHYRKHCDGARALAFNPSVEKSIEFAQRCNDIGIPAVHIDGKTDDGLRDSMMDDFEAGKIKIVSNCSLFSEGVDIPGLDAVIDTAPTASMAVYRQRVGRMLRKSPGKEHGIYLDCVGNSQLHGLPDDEISWELTTGKPEKKKPDVPPPRVCPMCFAANKAGTQRCRICGNAFPVEGRKVEQVDGELAELTPEQMEKREARQVQGMTKDLASLTQLGAMRGYKDPAKWAAHVLEGREKKMRKAG